MITAGIVLVLSQRRKFSQRNIVSSTLYYLEFPVHSDDERGRLSFSQVYNYLKFVYRESYSSYCLHPVQTASVVLYRRFIHHRATHIHINIFLQRKFIVTITHWEWAVWIGTYNRYIFRNILYSSKNFLKTSCISLNFLYLEWYW